MKRLLLVCAGVMLVACSKEEPPPEPVRPVLSIKVQSLDEESLGRFAGSIQARYETVSYTHLTLPTICSV